MAQNQIRIGHVDILSLSDGMLEFDLCNFFPTIPSENWHQYGSHLTEEHKVRFNLGSFLVRSEGRTILVDTGLGPKPTDAPETPWGTLLEDFAANGVRPDDIDMVVMTHLHRDHVGWNLQSQNGKYVPTFPRARYWMSRKDWEACHQAETQDRFPNAPTCVWPLAEMGLVEFMEGEHTLTRELSALPTPGHTPGHMSILITSQGERALILGDAAHNPAQVLETDWVSRADMDPEQTKITRRALMERLEREGTVVAAGHFPAPGFGKIVRLQGRRYWQVL
ncbi:MAG TPA: MBL fold metallo-hydrolase [Candidatus Tectomicrobia bacterium]|jgi:glyoxylase-like metal-dependent hydrolase (beta-lactamase superfamily II)